MDTGQSGQSIDGLSLSLSFSLSLSLSLSLFLSLSLSFSLSLSPAAAGDRDDKLIALIRKNIILFSFPCGRRRRVICRPPFSPLDDASQIGLSIFTITLLSSNKGSSFIKYQEHSSVEERDT
jgi:hypothetical protein